eukprot:s1447_g6.t1
MQDRCTHDSEIFLAALMPMSFAPRQDRQCHIVLNGSVLQGQFAVGRFPVMQAADLEIWEACPLPHFAWQVPNNCVICTRRGSGCVALGGGDYDGGLLQFTSDRALLAFLNFTHGGRTVPEFVAARKEIEDHVKSVQIVPVPLTSIMQYRHHCLTTPTPQIRGLLTAMAEKAQQAAFESLAPRRDGSLIRAVRLAVAAEKAYDAPKKVNAKAMIELGHNLLRDARLHMNLPRSTISIRPLFAFSPSQNKPEEALTICTSKFNLGQVWMPLPSVNLSAAAGAAIRCRMLKGTNLGRNMLFSMAFLLSSGANKVLLRILLVRVSHYAFMLGVLTNLLYITIFGLQFRYELKTAGEQDDESQADSFKFALNGRGLRLLAGAGACEAAAFVGLPLCASLLPGSLLPVMSQGLLIFSMIFSWAILGKRYDLLQVLGVVVVATGVGICTWPNLTADFITDEAFGGGLWIIIAAIGLFLSYGFISFSLVLKELAFIRFKQWRRENGHKKGDLNLEMVNFATALWQGWALMLLWPVNFAFLTRQDTATYFRSAFKAFRRAGVWLVAYLGVNLVYTEVTTIVLKQLSAVIFLLVNVLNVPLVSLFFCLKLPLLGAAPFRWSFVAGLVVIIGGLLTYNHKTLTAWRGSKDD